MQSLPIATLKIDCSGFAGQGGRKENLYSIGRLDRDTEGLLLITDNDPLGFQLLHPQYHVEKTYYVEVNGPLTPQDKIAFQEGIRF